MRRTFFKNFDILFQVKNFVKHESDSASTNDEGGRRLLQNSSITHLFSTIGLSKRIQVSGKILKKESDESFIFADTGAFCELRIETEDGTIRSRQLKVLEENEFVTLVDPQAAKYQKIISIVDCTSRC